jgi:hypothetical protein
MYVNENGQLTNIHTDHVNPSEAKQLLHKFNLDWNVEKFPLKFETPIVEPITNINFSPMHDSGFYGVVRTDNNDCFGAFTDQYETFQNSELAELVLEIADAIGQPISNGAEFKGGRKVMLQVDLNPVKIGDDTITRKATAINSHDGSTSLRWGTTGTTISCANQFSAISKELENSVRHTRNMRDAISRSLRIIEKMEEADKSLFEIFSSMTDYKVTQKQVNETINLITGVDVNMGETKAREQYSTRKLNQTSDLVQSIVKEMSYKGDTLWGLFSGVTHYTTHKGGSDRTREESKYVGGLQRLDQKVFNKFAMLVS